jgi:phosphotriesterase-related protein
LILSDLTNRRQFLAQAAAFGLSAGCLSDVASAKASVVQTVLGPMSGEQMGFTAAHEHILASSTGFMRLWPEFFGSRAQFIRGVVERMKAAKAGGIDTIVDCTTADLGRDVRLLQEVSRQSGVHIIAVTGHWLTPTPSFEARTADELAEFFTLEIERGMEGSGIKPGAIKAASQGESMTPFQENVFRAAARASKRTGVPVTTHSDARHRGGEQQAAIFEQEGLDPKRVCIGHSDESGDFDYLSGLARRGYTLGFDHLFYGLSSMGGGADGIPTWQERASTLRKLIDAGFNDRLLQASDWFFALTIAPSATIDVLKERNPFGNLFNVRNTLPYLRQMGVTEEQIRTITVTNPKAFFARS